jgi:hypothetical protein
MNFLPSQGITTDYAFVSNEPRQFMCVTPTLSRLGVDNFDNVQKIVDLQFTIEKATDEMKTILKTQDKEKVKRILKLGITREVIKI